MKACKSKQWWDIDINAIGTSERLAALLGYSLEINRKVFLDYILRHVHPLLGNGSVNTFKPQQIRTQQSDNFRFYATEL
jgi:hypothetical protein